MLNETLYELPNCRPEQAHQRQRKWTVCKITHGRNKSLPHGLWLFWISPKGLHRTRLQQILWISMTGGQGEQVQSADRTTVPENNQHTPVVSWLCLTTILNGLWSQECATTSELGTSSVCLESLLCSSSGYTRTLWILKSEPGLV